MKEYPHMCRMGHPEIGHFEDTERCPLCIALDELEKEHAAFVAAQNMVACILYQLGGEINISNYALLDVPTYFSISNETVNSKGIRLKLISEGDYWFKRNRPKACVLNTVETCGECNVYPDPIPEYCGQQSVRR